MMGYNNDGYIEMLHMTYDDFIKFESYTSAYNEFRLIEYNHNMAIFDIDASYIMKVIREYLDGFNSSWHLQSMVQYNERLYGMRIYEDWLKRDEWLPHFVSDRRIFYLLHEHKQCMKQRIRFLHFKEYIKEIDYRNLDNKMDKIIKTAKTIQLMALKCYNENKEIDKDILYEKIEDLMKRERDCYEELLELLKEGSKNRKSYNFKIYN
jgi:hypothetical protein